MAAGPQNTTARAPLPSPACARPALPRRPRTPAPAFVYPPGPPLALRPLPPLLLLLSARQGPAAAWGAAPGAARSGDGRPDGLPRDGRPAPAALLLARLLRPLARLLRLLLLMLAPLLLPPAMCLPLSYAAAPGRVPWPAASAAAVALGQPDVCRRTPGCRLLLLRWKQPAQGMQAPARLLVSLWPLLLLLLLLQLLQLVCHCGGYADLRVEH